MSAAWLLSQQPEVTVYERDRPHRRAFEHRRRCGLRQATLPVDTGFIVYNEAAYPNLTALFEHLDVPTQPSDMSFAVSLDDGALEYSGQQSRRSVCAEAQPVPPPLLVDAARFAAVLPRSAARRRASLDDVAPRSATISMPAAMAPPSATTICCRWRRRSGRRLPQRCSTIRRRRSSAFMTITGCCKLRNRPPWRTVTGGSRAYVERLTAAYADRHPDSAQACRAHPAIGRWRRRSRQQRAASNVRSRRHRHACRPGAGPAGRSRRRRSARCSAPSATASNIAVLHSDPALDAEAARGMVELELHRSRPAAMPRARSRP